MCSYTTEISRSENSDNLKPYIVINDKSQGSVATHFRCGGMFNNAFIANLLLNLSVKKTENWSAFGEDIEKKYTGNFFI